MTIDGKNYNGKSYKDTVTVKGGVPLEQYLIITFSVFIFLVAALIAAFCFWKRRNPAYLQVVRMEDGSGEFHFTYCHLICVYVVSFNFLPHTQVHVYAHVLACRGGAEAVMGYAEGGVGAQGGGTQGSAG